ncbi:DUF6274 family protein [Streptomyces huiliensis]|uniref:DUF6274 family protein n=1 Tax=Streptomyces huiliensis TaxID=2876027 RepID=UPI001CC0EAD0|nr:DUF6274 family protein [Streptomyces huiliensis]MBZ4318034.1 DUF6274 family protein [Streptomyces huiliensis]
MTTTSPTVRPRHETGALLRAHLSASVRYRHLTRHCAVCHRLLRLALEAAPTAAQGGPGTRGAPGKGPAA